MSSRNNTRARRTRALMPTLSASSRLWISVLNDEVNPNAARVAIDALKWTAARMMPRRYGDRIQADLAGDITVIVDKVHDPS